MDYFIYSILPELQFVIEELFRIEGALLYRPRLCFCQKWQAPVRSLPDIFQGLCCRDIAADEGQRQTGAIELIA